MTGVQTCALPIFNNDRFYSEDEEGNYSGNFYSKCRVYLENIAKNYNNLLYIRINYPISSHKSNKNLITKLLSYPTIQDNVITLTYIDELIPFMINMIENGEIGICNLVNEGKISGTIKEFFADLLIFLSSKFGGNSLAFACLPPLTFPHPL